jgi:serralysin
MTTTNMLEAINWGTQISVPANRVITYSFLTAGSTPLATNSGAQTLGQNGVPNSTVAFTEAEKQTVRDVLATYAKYLNLTFQEAAGPTVFTFGMENLTGNTTGFMQPPGQVAAGYCALDTGRSVSGSLPGSDFFETVLHEVGHGLGLAHPHDTGGTSQIFSGVTASGDLGDLNLNQDINTIMSYNDGWVTAPGGNTRLADRGNMIGPMAFDIAVLQAKYGANTTNNNGDNLYSLNGNNVAGIGFQSIWDTGGNDTIAYFGVYDAHINLNSASLAYGANGGGAVSSVGVNTLNGDGIPVAVAGVEVDGYTIASDVVIENATGGSGRDILIGNAYSNILIGNSGSDALYGGDGFDTLIGGSEGDFLDGGEGRDKQQQVE